MTKTSGTITSHEPDHQPGEPVDARSKAVSTCWPARLLGHACRNRSARRWPRSPPWPSRSRRWCRGSRCSCARWRRRCRARSAASVFSTGMDSPVSVAWMTNRSLAERSRTSPGIMSPAESLTTSPGTSSLERDFPGLAVAHDGGGDADHRLELGGGRVGAGFLDEAQRHAQDHHQQHHRAGPEVPEAVFGGVFKRGRGELDDRQDREQDDERVFRRRAQPPEPAVGLFLGDFVGAVPGEPRLGLRRGQPFRRGSALLQHRARVLACRFGKQRRKADCSGGVRGRHAVRVSQARSRVAALGRPRVPPAGEAVIRLVRRDRRPPPSLRNDPVRRASGSGAAPAPRRRRRQGSAIWPAAGGARLRPGVGLIRNFFWIQKSPARISGR